MSTQDNNNDAVESGRLGRYAAVVFLGLLLVIGGVYWAAYTWGRGGRGYFSPETLEIRSRAEWSIPYASVVIYREAFEYRTLKLVQFLVEEGIWTRLETDSPTWIRCFQWGPNKSHSQSSFYRACARDVDALIAWTKANPEMARYVWPRVLNLLRSPPDGSYAAESTLLFWAQTATSIEELKQYCDAEGIPLD